MLSRDQDKLGERLSAYLDGELSALEAAGVERLLESDPEARAMLGSLRRTVETVRSLPHRPAPGSLLPELTARIERAHLLGDMPETAQPVRTWRRSMWRLLASAAMVVFVVGGGFWMFTRVSDSGRGRERQLALLDEAPTPAPRSAMEMDGEKKDFIAGRKGLRGGRAEVEKESVVAVDKPKAAPAEPSPRSRVAGDVGVTASGEGAADLSFAARSIDRKGEVFADDAADSAQSVETNADIVWSGADSYYATGAEDSLATKLAHGIPRSAVLAHSPSNELLNLDIASGCDVTLDQVEGHVVALLTRHAIRPLTEAIPADDEPVSPTATFFVAGEPVSNGKGCRYLVRAKPADLVKIAEEIGADSGRPVELRVGRWVAGASPERIREVLHDSLAGAPSRRAAVAPRLAIAAKDRSAARDGFEAAEEVPAKPGSAASQPTTQPVTDHDPALQLKDQFDPSEVITVVINLRVAPPDPASDQASRTPTTQPVTTQPTTRSAITKDP